MPTTARRERMAAGIDGHAREGMERTRIVIPPEAVTITLAII